MAGHFMTCFIISSLYRITYRVVYCSSSVRLIILHNALVFVVFFQLFRLQYNYFEHFHSCFLSWNLFLEADKEFENPILIVILWLSEKWLCKISVCYQNVFNANQAFFFIITPQFEVSTETEVFELP